MTNSPTLRKRAVALLLLLAAAFFLALHWVHLRADFPNHSRWMDWSKYTDEGWYGDAAIRHFQLGHWYVPGDFNPAAALPVWPLAEAMLFRFTGVSVAAARSLSVAVFAGTLVAGWFLLTRRRHSASSDSGWIGASAALLLLATNPFCFVFTRLAIVEPMLVLLMLLALLVARREQRTAESPLGVSPPTPASWLPDFLANASVNASTIVGLGILLPMMVLTKTTALFLVPSIAWTLFAASGYRFRRFLRTAIPAGLLGVALWLAYFLLIVRPHYLLDYRYLFSANAYTAMTRDNFVSVLAAMLKDGKWMGRVLYPLALASCLLALAGFRRLKQYPTIPALLLWVAGYMSFLAYHNNLQPRYYLVVAVPLTLLIPIVVEDLVLPRFHRNMGRAAALLAVAVACAFIVVPDARDTLRIVRQPEYTLVDAAAHIADYIAQDRQTDPAHNPLILSISGSELSLMNGLPSICDDFGTLELLDRIKKYQPGWYVAWNQIEDDKMDALAPLYHLERVAAFPAMDDPDRNLLILYRLDATIVTPPIVRKRPPAPRRLRTKVGQQPSTNQLQH